MKPYFQDYVFSGLEKQILNRNSELSNDLSETGITFAPYRDEYQGVKGGGAVSQYDLQRVKSTFLSWSQSITPFQCVLLYLFLSLKKSGNWIKLSLNPNFIGVLVSSSVKCNNMPTWLLSELNELIRIISENNNMLYNLCY